MKLAESTLAAAPMLSRGPAAERDAAPRTDHVLRPAAVAMAFLGPGHRHEEIAVPGVALAAHEVLVVIEVSTICELDVQIARGLRPASVPVVLGHESVGRVIGIGAGGADAADGGRLQVGDRVVWAPVTACGVCDRCESGRSQDCRTPAVFGGGRIGPHRELTGGFGGHAQLSAGTLIARVPESLPGAVLAPASCAIVAAWTAVQAAAHGRDLEGARVRVRGTGLTALAATAIAHAHGAEVELLESGTVPRRLAERFGATVITNREPEPGIVIRAAERAVAQPCTASALTAAISFLAGPGRAYPFADAISAVRPLRELDAALAAAGAADAPPRIAVAVR